MKTSSALDAEAGELVFDDRLAQEIVALLGAVAAEGLAVAQLVDGGVHGLAAGAGSGSVTSPMPQRMRFAAASGLASEKAFTRRAISGKR